MNLKKVLISGIAALTLSGSAIAADNTQTRLATDGTGDYLILPYYAAIGDWETNIRIVNTNPSDAIVAKVVLREFKQSEEVLDFPVYLSPGDVWEGKIKLKDGKPYLYSEDDSLIVSAPLPLALNEKKGGQQPNFGYIEIFGVAQIPAGNIRNLLNNLNLNELASKCSFSPNSPFSKECIVKAYKNSLNGVSSSVNVKRMWKGVDCNSLYAEEILFENNKKLAMTLPATALEGVTGSNPNDKSTIGRDTTPANSIIPDRNPENNQPRTVNQVLDQVAEVLNKSHIYVPYYDYNVNGDGFETALIITQPLVKYRGVVDHVVEAGFFYKTITRDMKENSDYSENDVSGFSEQAEYCLFANYSRTAPTEYNPPSSVYGQLSSRLPNGVTFPAGLHGHEICVIPLKDKFKKKNIDFENGYVDFDLTGYKVMGRYVRRDDGSRVEYRAMIPTIMTVKKVGGEFVTNIMYAPYRK